MQFPAPELIAAARCQLAEGPCWDPARAELLWVDIPAGVVHRLADDRCTRITVGRAVGAAIPTSEGELLVCRQGDIVVVDRDGDRTCRLHELEGNQPDLRPNDAKCDALGRLWVGTTRFDHDAPVGTLYRVAGRRPPAPVLTELWCSNGLGWAPDNRTMYFIDSPSQRVDALRFSLETGEVSDRTCFAKIDPSDGVPDGLCVDIEGGVWVALWDGGAVRRYTPDGTVSGQIELPVRRVTSCCFGGPSWTDLYITTARTSESSAERLGGAVFRARPGIAGLPTNTFKTTFPA